MKTFNKKSLQYFHNPFFGPIINKGLRFRIEAVTSNISPSALELFSFADNADLALLFYVYAVLSCESYLNTFEGVLFAPADPKSPPRIPFASDVNVRRKISSLGSQIQSIKIAFRRLCKECCIKASPHVLRHTAATWLVMDGVPLWNVNPTVVSVHDTCVEIVKAMSLDAAQELRKIDRFQQIYVQEQRVRGNDTL